MSPLLDALRAAIGASHVLAEGDLAAYEIDWRKRFAGKALAVVRPASTDEVARVVRLCREHGASIVAQGGNTGLVGGSVPDASGTQIVLSLGRMQRVRSIDVANLTMTVEAGCVLQKVQEAAAQEGLLFALSLAAEGSCTIGGNLATNAGGTQVLRYGNARELCLGLEVVTASGEVWDGLTALRKDNTGYDLRDLMIGSEGTLGIITAAALKLHPRPAATLTAMASLPTLAAAVDLLALAHGTLGPGLTGFEVMNEASLALVRKHFAALRQPLAAAPWTVLIEHSDFESEAHGAASLEALLTRALERNLIQDTAVASNLEQASAMWHLRESIPLAQATEGPERQARHLAAGLGGLRLRQRDGRSPAARLSRRPADRLRASGRRQPALQRAMPVGRRCGRVPAPPRARGQRSGLRRGRRARRLDLGRAWRRQPETRRAGGAQVAGGAGDDACDQARARPFGRAESGARAVAVSQAVKAATSGLPAACVETMTQ